MTEASQYPLVTFALFAYNQEKYVREAVEAALAQDYPNLEIIVSDDASSDATWQVIQECVADFVGPHTLVLNRNESNLGIIAHIKLVRSLSRGRYMVMAAGDDVSSPQRATRMIDAFQLDKSVHAVFTDVCRIDKHGSVINGHVRVWPEGRAFTLEPIVAGAGGVGIGASYAYRMECFDWPWPLPSTLVSEDKILPLRAALLGGVAHVPEAHVKYRSTGGSLTDEMRRSGTRPGSRADHRTELTRTLQLACEIGKIDLRRLKEFDAVIAGLPLINQVDAYTLGWPGLLRSLALSIVGNTIHWRTLPARVAAKVRRATSR